MAPVAVKRSATVRLKVGTCDPRIGSKPNESMLPRELRRVRVHDSPNQVLVRARIHNLACDNLCRTKATVEHHIEKGPCRSHKLLLQPAALEATRSAYNPQPMHALAIVRRGGWAA
jgi:hypothetical protein